MVETFKIDHETMQRFGIHYLTSEADALSMRMLCEVTPEIMGILLQYMGLSSIDPDTLPCSGYNNKNMYSCFLTWEVVEDLIIMKLVGIYGCVVECNPSETGKAYVSQKHLLAGSADEVRERTKSTPYSHWEYNSETDEHNRVEGTYDVGRTYQLSNQPRRGFSNVHAFTGMSQ